MTRTLYVGNLPWSTTEEELAEILSAYAEVRSCRIITDRDTGRSRGFGFVEIAAEDVDRVISEVNGIEVQGRQLTVNLAQERKPRSRRSY